MQTAYSPTNLRNKIIDYSLIAAGSLAIGAVAGAIGLKAMTRVLNNHMTAAEHDAWLEQRKHHGYRS